MGADKRYSFILNRHVSDGAICLVGLAKEFSKHGRTKIYGKSRSENIPEGIFQKFSDEELNSDSWWKKHASTIVFFYTLTDFPPAALRRAKENGAIVVIDADTDGVISPRMFPALSIKKFWDPRNNFIKKLKILKAWLYTYQNFPLLESQIIENGKIADVIRVESDIPAEYVRRFFLNAGAKNLIDKVSVIPFAVRNEFTAELPIETKCNLIISAGRLGSQQKDPTLLGTVAKKLALEFPEWRLEIHVRGKCEFLRRTCNENTNLGYFENSTRATLVRRLNKAKIFFSCSRYETTPIAALEALCCGCSVVGPDVPGYRSITTKSGDGRIFLKRRAESAVKAVQAECAAWNHGQRDPVKIASNWQNHVSIKCVTRQLLLLGHS